MPRLRVLPLPWPALAAAVCAAACTTVRLPNADYRVRRNGVQHRAHGRWELVERHNARGKAYPWVEFAAGASADVMMATVPGTVACSTVQAQVVRGHIRVIDRLVDMDFDFHAHDTALVSADDGQTHYLFRKVKRQPGEYICE